MTGAPRFHTALVTLNLFQGPSCNIARFGCAEEWMLKQVQHDEDGEVLA
jgi:hypothetical protein